MARLAAHERAALLHRAADAIERDASQLAATITAEQGKHTADARAEAGRIAGIVRLCADEACRLDGRVLPLDVAPAGVGRLAYTRPEPTGVVVAISPFNYPRISWSTRSRRPSRRGTPGISNPAAPPLLTPAALSPRLRGGGLPRG